MEFLNEDEDKLNGVIKLIPENIKKDLENNKELVKTNLNYIKELGVINYLDVFKMYYPMFLMDASNFANIFNKYDKNDLLDKINKNITIIEHL